MATSTAPEATASSKAHIEYGYPQGHLGHLTPTETTALAEFQAHLAAENLYTPANPPSTPASHEDTVLLRFLRARRWSIPDATAQFRTTSTWRAAQDLDTLYATIDVAAYDAARRLYPQWTGRRDRRGIPVYVFEIRHLDAKAIQRALDRPYSRAQPTTAEAKKTPGMLVRLGALYENLTRFVQPLCSQVTADREHERTPITLSTNIVDVSGVSLKGFWNLKGHMQMASQLATAHYPETLDRIFILGAPYFFTTVWGWIKRWFDPVTVSKIFILSSAEVYPTLSTFIDPANIPRQYGGQLDFTWGDMPKLDPKIRALAEWENGHSDFPIGPLYWEPVDGGRRMRCLARGSVDQKERNEVVCTIPVAFPAADAVANGDGEKIDKPEEETKEEVVVVPADSAQEVQTPLSPASETFHDAAEEPLPAVQNLSLKDPVEETVVQADANGKPVSAS